ncbi:MAG TPA: hypothetical protein VFZ53_03075 [Polyangiaceae bacterium]
MFHCVSKGAKRSVVGGMAVLGLGCSVESGPEAELATDEGALARCARVSVSASRSAVSEAGDRAYFRVALTERPRGPVRVTATNGSTVAVAVAPATLSFRPNDWDVPQTFTVSAVDDSEFDGDIDAAITLTASSPDQRFAGSVQALSVRAVDDDFQVVGYRARRLHGVESGAVAINNRNQVALTIAGSPHHAFLWEEGVLTDLMGLDPSRQSHAVDINDDGTVLGWNDTLNGVVRFLYREGQLAATQGEVWAINDRGHTAGDALYADGARTELPDIGPAPALGRGLSDDDAVTGTAPVEPFGAHAFFWDDGVFTDLGTFGGPVGEGLAVNDHGHAVGRMFTPEIVNRPFLYAFGAVVDVGTVGPSPGGSVRAINNRNDMVGADEDAARIPERGWVGRLGTMRAIIPLLVDGSCFQVVEPADVNDGGVIAGRALACGENGFSAYVFEPVKIAPGADPPGEDI